MAANTNTGFTIIETMLFFAVAGALTALILATSSISINQQRYRDSVNSLKSFVQQQYSETTNVSNSRSGVEACSSGVVVPSPSATNAKPRGTSDCVLLGRYISVDATGKKVTASNVVASRVLGAPSAASDILEVRNNYTLGLSPIDISAAEVAWGAVVVQKGTTQPAPTSILILRSPLSGGLMTYTTSGSVSSSQLKTMITVGNSNKITNLCVHAAMGAFQGNQLAVQISPYAAGQSAVQVSLESSDVCA